MNKQAIEEKPDEEMSLESEQRVVIKENDLWQVTIIPCSCCNHPEYSPCNNDHNHQKTKTDKINQNSMYEVAKQTIVYVDEKVFNTITEVKNPQGILAVIGKKNEEDT